MSDKKGKRINSLQYHANTPKFILDMQAKLGGGNERRVRNPEDYNSEEEEEREDREDEKPQVVVLDEKKHLSQEEAEVSPIAFYKLLAYFDINTSYKGNIRKIAPTEIICRRSKNASEMKKEKT
eukprot:Colp12_sorted_trinity150504_noHs@30096